MTQDGAVLASATRKATRRLIPFLFVLYVAAYLDRINIGFAQLQMKSALAFSDTIYGFGTGVFFFGYAMFEVPSNLVLARTGARRWIARIMISWGLISAGMAFITTPMSFYVLRFLLGVAEAGFFPGIVYYLCQWFPARERAAAISRFMTATAVAGIIGGPVSGALLKLDGVLGLAGWQWIFVAEGLPSCVLGLWVLSYLTERPRDAQWLTAEEREALDASMQADAARIAGRGPADLRSVLRHPLVWRLALLDFLLVIGYYSLNFWGPQLIKSFSTMGNVAVAVVSALPYVVAAAVMVVVGKHSDRTGERRWHVAGCAFVGAAGLVACTFARAPVFGLIALSVAAAGIWTSVPIFWTLPTAMLTGTAAAAAIALINCIGSLSGFVGPYLIGRVKDATGSFSASLLTIAALIAAGGLLALTFRDPAARPAPESAGR